jgi:hypothetical protein
VVVGVTNGLQGRDAKKKKGENTECVKDASFYTTQSVPMG